MNIRDLIEVDLEKMSGTPCFTGTRVPVNHLFDYLEAGDSLVEFLNDFRPLLANKLLVFLNSCERESSLNMKLLLDECVPKRLRNDFTGHEVRTVEEVGLKGMKNGHLLRAAAELFDALITVDRRMPTYCLLVFTSVARQRALFPYRIIRNFEGFHRHARCSAFRGA